ncbi:H-2 class II histocompatibility antigen, E-B beta chain-like [Stegastes partitus]|uniref:H-2 class II histocompatibility antigen, E-B beta chain-like n=1 Tax=Stegastes partitus TaxID=144197 RepID=A0A9Y4N8B5_9TELE|nr:PREDICTED: H-2 class II histocompatibility antigen, E-B beta chain-like [Stegastes partitus]
MKRFKYLLLLWLLSPSMMDCSADEDGYFMYTDHRCSMHSRDKEQVEYLVDWYFNKEFTMQYNSTVGKWTGFTPAGVITALEQNVKQDFLQRIVERDLICVNNVELIYNITEEYMGKYLLEYPGFCCWDRQAGFEQKMAPGEAPGFYTRAANQGTPTNGDWTYQFHSYLEHTPGGKDKVSCTVDHASLKEPKICSWDSSVDQSTRSFVAGGVCALILGAIFVSLGLTRYWRKSRPNVSNVL